MKKRKILLAAFPSHPTSRHLRNIIEHTKYKRVAVANIAIAAVILNVAFTSPSHAFDYQTSDSLPIAAQATDFSTKTENAFQFPVTKSLGLSQGYHAFHPGVDIRSPRGSDVVAAADGTVIEVQYLTTGYGHHVRIAHAGTLSTLYAHLDKVEVKVGQKVEKGQKIGTIGMTGWSTGPHLHFEVHEGVNSVNPKTALSL